MHFCYVIDENIFRPAGVQYYILDLSDWLIKNGHKVTILHSTNNSVLKRNINPEINVINIAKGFDIKFFSINGGVSVFPGFANKKNLYNIFAESNFDVVHCNYPFSPFISGRVLKVLQKLKAEDKSNPKTLTTFHVYVEEFFLGRIANKALSLFFLNTKSIVDTFISTGVPTKEYGEKYLKVKSVYIPIGLNIGKRMKKEARRREGERLNILFLGRLQTRKGVLDFIRALILVQKETLLLNNVDIIVGGDGPEKIEAERLSKEAGLNIKFLGQVNSEKYDIYKEADIAVFPTKYGETFGIVLIEAMSSGCSIIGYANEGYKSTMGKFASKCLVDPGNVNALKDKIIEFLTNKEENVLNLGLNLKHYFDKTFDMEIVGKKYLETVLD